MIMWFQLLLHIQKSILADLVGRDGKIYFRFVDIAAPFNKTGVYSFVKCFQHVAFQGEHWLPFHKDYPVITKRTQLVPPDVMYNILSAENVPLGPVLPRH
ncbi:hypothetical protein NPIL_534771 [Nephila pilipes]|uniref:Uncharacterized protein n=1 Tax=Nephila pilipes TaxID=299642 RepID=A0A8X6PQJ1_NEPPI|nr:hypothetical protein NPIL_534771 [Nephila pilipes]